MLATIGGMLGGLLLIALLAEPARQIAVLELAVDGGAEPEIGHQLTNRLAEVLGARPNTKVMAPDDLRALLDQEAKKQAVGCTDDSCMAEIAGAVGADWLVSGRVSKIEGGFAIALTLVDAHRASALAHVNETWMGHALAILDLVPPMVDKLFATDKAALVGSISIQGAVSGTQVMIDGDLKGTPDAPIEGVPIGARKLELVAPGHLPLVRFVAVKTGGVALVSVSQEAEPSSPLYAKWWFWTVLAVGVAGAGAGTYFALTSGSTEPGATNPSGVNVAVTGAVLEGR